MDFYITDVSRRKNPLPFDLRQSKDLHNGPEEIYHPRVIGIIYSS